MDCTEKLFQCKKKQVSTANGNRKLADLETIMSKSSNKSMFSHGMAKWGLVMGLLFVVWFGGWFVLANFADGKIGETIGMMKGHGIDLGCDNRQIKGFPFRIGVNCDQVNISSAGDAFQLKGGALRTTAILYAPGEMIAELDGPYKVWPGGVEISANWEMMRLFVDANFSGGFERVSLNYSKVEVKTKLARLAIGEGGLHLRPTPGEETSLDIAGNADDLTALVEPFLQVPKASLSADIMLKDGYSKLVLERRPLLQVMRDGMSINLRSANLRVPEGGRLVFSGPLEMHPDGTFSGEIRIGVANVNSLVAWAEKIDPQLQQIVAGIGQAVAGMGKKIKFGNEELSSISVQIKHGVVQSGFIQLAKIPPIILE